MKQERIAEAQHAWRLALKARDAAQEAFEAADLMLFTVDYNHSKEWRERKVHA